MFELLHYLLLQVKAKANTISVSSTLGGGSQVYTETILSPATYVTLTPLTPFVPPTYPEILQVPPGATQYAITLAKSQHEQAIHTFGEY